MSFLWGERPEWYIFKQNAEMYCGGEETFKSPHVWIWTSPEKGSSLTRPLQENSCDEKWWRPEQLFMELVVTNAGGKCTLQLKNSSVNFSECHQQLQSPHRGLVSFRLYAILSFFCQGPKTSTFPSSPGKGNKKTRKQENKTSGSKGELTIFKIILWLQPCLLWESSF